MLALIAAVGAGIAAWRTVVWARRTLESQRAWIVHKHFSVELEWESQPLGSKTLAGLRVSNHWENGGGTAGLVTRMFVRALYVAGDPPQWEEGDFTVPQNLPYLRMRAGVGLPIRDAGVVIPFDICGAAYEGQTTIYIWSVVVYRDLFEPRKDRHTEWLTKAIPMADIMEIQEGNHSPPYFRWETYGGDKFQRAD